MIPTGAETGYLVIRAGSWPTEIYLFMTLQTPHVHIEKSDLKDTLSCANDLGKKKKKHFSQKNPTRLQLQKNVGWDQTCLQYFSGKNMVKEEEMK